MTPLYLKLLKDKLTALGMTMGWPGLTLVSYCPLSLCCPPFGCCSSSTQFVLCASASSLESFTSSSALWGSVTLKLKPTLPVFLRVTSASARWSKSWREKMETDWCEEALLALLNHQYLYGQCRQNELVCYTESFGELLHLVFLGGWW